MMLVESRQGNLSNAMKLVGKEITQRKNRIPDRDAPLILGSPDPREVRSQDKSNL